MFVLKEYTFHKGFKKQRNWNTKILEGFVLDTMYLSEYGKEDGSGLAKVFKKSINKKKDFLNEVLKTDISLRYTGYASVGSYLGYTIDKIHNIFLGHKEKCLIYTLTTENNRIIKLTGEQEVLTQSGYIKIKDLDIHKDRIMALHGNSFLLKKHKKKINDGIIIAFKVLGEKFKDNNVINITNLNNEELIYIYYLGISIIDQEVKKEDFLILQENYLNTNKKKSKIKDSNLMENIFGDKNTIRYETIKSLTKKEEKNVLLFNISTALAENLIMNNIIIKQ